MRSTSRTVVAVLSLLALGLALMAPAHAAKAATSVALAAASASVPEGTAVKVTATLRKAGRVYAGVPVKVQSRAAGSTAWSTVRTARTNTAGKVTATSAKLFRATEFRAVFAGNAKARPSASRTRPVRVTPWIKVASYTRNTLPDGVVRVTGTTSRSLVDEVIFLEYREVGTTTWNGGSSVRVPSGGAFAFEHRAVVSGAVEFRITTDAVTPALVRSLGTVAVYEYLGSGKLAMGDNGNLYTSLSLVNNGKTYDWTYSNEGAEQAYINWAPTNQAACTRFAGKIAIADDTGQPGEQKRFVVTVRRPGGSTVHDLGAMQEGQAAKPFSIDITDATSFEMRISTVSGGSATGFFADAGIYCP